MALSPLFSLPRGRALALIAALSCAWSGPASAAETAPAACPTLLQKSFKRLQDDAPQNLCQYAGKVLLVVNTASYCGFTPQYEGLEKIYAQYGSKGLVVLGFPSNDFGEVPTRCLPSYPRPVAAARSGIFINTWSGAMASSSIVTPALPNPTAVAWSKTSKKPWPSPERAQQLALQVPRFRPAACAA